MENRFTLLLSFLSFLPHFFPSFLLSFPTSFIFPPFFLPSFFSLFFLKTCDYSSDHFSKFGGGEGIKLQIIILTWKTDEHSFFPSILSFLPSFFLHPPFFPFFLYFSFFLPSFLPTFLLPLFFFLKTCDFSSSHFSKFVVWGGVNYKS